MKFRKSTVYTISDDNGTSRDQLAVNAIPEEDDTNEEAVFDQIIDEIGSYGRYQKQFNFIFNFLCVGLISMTYSNNIFAVAVADHWCYVPGRDTTNFTIEEWKNRTIPYDVSTDELIYSSCTMFNVTADDSWVQKGNYENSSILPPNIIECQNGWEYDKTWYTETATSAENWVCERDLYAANSLAFGKFGDIIGTLIFGQLGDTLGRRPVYYLTLIILIIGRTMMAYTSSNFILFAIASVIGSLTSTAVYNSPMIIAMEISPSNYRATVVMIQSLSWTIASIVMPLIMWAVGDWVIFMLLTTLPSAIFLFTNRFLVESPRWLLTRGKTDECLKQLEHIAKVNKKKLPIDAKEKLEKVTEENEKFFGVFGCFSSWRLGMVTTIMLYISTAVSLSYYVLVYNSVQMKGNPFLNYAWQSAAEFPGYVIGQLLCDRIGRRLSGVLSYLLSFIFLVALIFVVSSNEYVLHAEIFTSIVRFFISVTYYVSALQTLELYPTCIRQSSNSFFIIVSSGAGIVAPYVVFMGNNIDERMPFIIITIAMGLCAVTGFFLPETLNESLPETLHEAQVFGANQKYFSFKIKRPVHHHCEKQTESK